MDQPSQTLTRRSFKLQSARTDDLDNVEDLFTFRPLEPPSSFRVIKPLPNTALPDDAGPQRTLRFSIEELSLDSPSLSYRTISYAWGTGEKTHAIHLDGLGCRGVLRTTENAWSALRVITGDHPEDYLWMDQICINQENFEERSQQVSLMAQIFARSEECVIWLGPEDKWTKDAFHLINILQKNLPDLVHKDAQHERTRLSLKFRQDLIRRFGEGTLQPNHPGWEAMKHVLARSWFTRLWTFQESVISANLILRCGDLRTAWESFALTAMLLGYGDYNDGKAAAYVIEDHRQMRAEGRRVSLLHLLNDVRVNFACTDPRDRIFALLDVQPDFKSHPILQANYSQTDAELFIKVAKYLIADSFSVLQYVFTYDGEGEVEGLPSFVPDWTDTSGPWLINYDLHFWSSQGRKHTVAQNDSERELTVSGKLVAKVTGVIYKKPEKFDYGSSPSERIDEFRNVLMPSILEALGSCERSVIEEIRVSIVRTVCCDRSYVMRALREEEDEEEEKKEEKEEAQRADTIHRECNEEQDSQSIGEDVVGPHIPCEYRKAINLMLDQLMDEEYVHFNLDEYANTSHQPSRLDKWLRGFVPALTTMWGRYIVSLDRYSFAMCPHTTLPGDGVYILHGSTVPIVLRPTEGGKYTLVGPCFVDGIMYGESVDWEKDEADTFCIV
ncbi:MAG: hypothetical protein Q9227_008725 [Pyrenula ochraceoflavens]